MTASERIRAARETHKSALVGALDQTPVETRENLKPSANGYLIEANGFTLHASWAAPFFALTFDDPDASNYDPEPMLFHCETLDCAKRHLQLKGDVILNHAFEVVE